MTIKNDSAIGLGDSIEVVDTDVDNSVNDGGDGIGDNGDRTGDSESVDAGDGVGDTDNAGGDASIGAVDGDAGDTNVIKGNPKVHRPCPYCLKLQSALTRHLKTVHKKEEEVMRALALPTSQEKNKAFDNMKKNGILKYNKDEMKKENPSYMRERKGDNKVVVCSSCKGCYSKGYKARHQIECGKNSGQ